MKLWSSVKTDHSEEEKEMLSLLESVNKTNEALKSLGLSLKDSIFAYEKLVEYSKVNECDLVWLDGAEEFISE